MVLKLTTKIINQTLRNNYFHLLETTTGGAGGGSVGVKGGTEKRKTFQYRSKILHISIIGNEDKKTQ